MSIVTENNDIGSGQDFLIPPHISLSSEALNVNKENINYLKQDSYMTQNLDINLHCKNLVYSSSEPEDIAPITFDECQGSKKNNDLILLDENKIDSKRNINEYINVQSDNEFPTSNCLIFVENTPKLALNSSLFNVELDDKIQSSSSSRMGTKKIVKIDVQRVALTNETENNLQERQAEPEALTSRKVDIIANPKDKVSEPQTKADLKAKVNEDSTPQLETDLKAIVDKDSKHSSAADLKYKANEDELRSDKNIKFISELEQYSSLSFTSNEMVPKIQSSLPSRMGTKKIVQIDGKKLALTNETKNNSQECQAESEALIYRKVDLKANPKDKISELQTKADFKAKVNEKSTPQLETDLKTIVDKDNSVVDLKLKANNDELRSDKNIKFISDLEQCSSLNSTSNEMVPSIETHALHSTQEGNIKVLVNKDLLVTELNSDIQNDSEIPHNTSLHFLKEIETITQSQPAVTLSEIGLSVANDIYSDSGKGFTSLASITSDHSLLLKKLDKNCSSLKLTLDTSADQKIAESCINDVQKENPEKIKIINLDKEKNKIEEPEISACTGIRKSIQPQDNSNSFCESKEPIYVSALPKEPPLIMKIDLLNNEIKFINDVNQKGSLKQNENMNSAEGLFSKENNLLANQMEQKIYSACSSSEYSSSHNKSNILVHAEKKKLFHNLHKNKLQTKKICRSKVVEQINLDELRKPLDKGFRREVVYRVISTNKDQCDIYYRPPTGPKLRSMVETRKFLDKTNSEFKEENFSFSHHPLGFGEPLEVVRNATQRSGRPVDKTSQVPKMTLKINHNRKYKNSCISDNNSTSKTIHPQKSKLNNAGNFTDTVVVAQEELDEYCHVRSWQNKDTNMSFNSRKPLIMKFKRKLKKTKSNLLDESTKIKGIIFNQSTSYKRVRSQENIQQSSKRLKNNYYDNNNKLHTELGKCKKYRNFKGKRICKPLSPPMKHFYEVMDKVVKDNPGLKTYEISKIIDSMWRNLSSEERKKYEESYNDEMHIYEESLFATADSESCIEASGVSSTIETNGVKHKKRKRKSVIDDEFIKPALPPATKHFNKVRLEVAANNPNMMHSEICNLIGSMWNNLPEEEKLKYGDEIKTNKVSFNTTSSPIQQNSETSIADKVILVEDLASKNNETSNKGSSAPTSSFVSLPNEKLLTNSKKAPVSPYFKFYQKMKLKFIGKNPSELRYIVNSMWANISNLEKSALLAEYQREKLAYEKSDFAGNVSKKSGPLNVFNSENISLSSTSTQSIQPISEKKNYLAKTSIEMKNVNQNFPSDNVVKKAETKKIQQISEGSVPISKLLEETCADKKTKQSHPTNSRPCDDQEIGTNNKNHLVSEKISLTSKQFIVSLKNISKISDVLNEDPQIIDNASTGQSNAPIPVFQMSVNDYCEVSFDNNIENKTSRNINVPNSKHESENISEHALSSPKRPRIRVRPLEEMCDQPKENKCIETVIEDCSALHNPCEKVQDQSISTSQECLVSCRHNVFYPNQELHPLYSFTKSVVSSTHTTLGNLRSTENLGSTVSTSSPMTMVFSNQAYSANNLRNPQVTTYISINNCSRFLNTQANYGIVPPLQTSLVSAVPVRPICSLKASPSNVDMRDLSQVNSSFQPTGGQPAQGISLSPSFNVSPLTISVLPPTLLKSPLVSFPIQAETNIPVNKNHNPTIVLVKDKTSISQNSNVPEGNINSTQLKSPALPVVTFSGHIPIIVSQNSSLLNPTHIVSQNSSLLNPTHSQNKSTTKSSVIKSVPQNSNVQETSCVKNVSTRPTSSRLQMLNQKSCYFSNCIQEETVASVSSAILGNSGACSSSDMTKEFDKESQGKTIIASSGTVVPPIQTPFLVKSQPTQNAVLGTSNKASPKKALITAKRTKVPPKLMPKLACNKIVKLQPAQKDLLGTSVNSRLSLHSPKISNHNIVATYSGSTTKKNSNSQTTKLVSEILPQNQSHHLGPPISTICYSPNFSQLKVACTAPCTTYNKFLVSQPTNLVSILLPQNRDPVQDIHAPVTNKYYSSIPSTPTLVSIDTGSTSTQYLNSKPTNLISVILPQNQSLQVLSTGTRDITSSNSLTPTVFTDSSSTSSQLLESQPTNLISVPLCNQSQQILDSHANAGSNSHTPNIVSTAPVTTLNQLLDSQPTNLNSAFIPQNQSFPTFGAPVNNTGSNSPRSTIVSSNPGLTSYQTKNAVPTLSQSQSIQKQDAPGNSKCHASTPSEPNVVSTDQVSTSKQFLVSQPTNLVSAMLLQNQSFQKCGIQVNDGCNTSTCSSSNVVSTDPVSNSNKFLSSQIINEVCGKLPKESENVQRTSRFKNLCQLAPEVKERTPPMTSNPPPVGSDAASNDFLPNVVTHIPSTLKSNPSCHHQRGSVTPALPGNPGSGDGIEQPFDWLTESPFNLGNIDSIESLLPLQDKASNENPVPSVFSGAPKLGGCLSIMEKDEISGFDSSPITSNMENDGDESPPLGIISEVYSLKNRNSENMFNNDSSSFDSIVPVFTSESEKMTSNSFNCEVPLKRKLVPNCVNASPTVTISSQCTNIQSVVPLALSHTTTTVSSCSESFSSNNKSTAIDKSHSNVEYFNAINRSEAINKSENSEGGTIVLVNFNLSSLKTYDGVFSSTEVFAVMKIGHSQFGELLAIRTEKNGQHVYVPASGTVVFSPDSLNEQLKNVKIINFKLLDDPLLNNYASCDSKSSDRLIKEVPVVTSKVNSSSNLSPTEFSYDLPESINAVETSYS